MSDYIEYTPKRHGQRPPYWTSEMEASVDGHRFIHQDWAWIAGTVYYVPYEAVHGVPRLAPVDADADAGPVDDYQRGVLDGLKMAYEIADDNIMSGETALSIRALIKERGA